MKEVFDYFAQFRYAPTKQEVIKFYPRKIKKIILKKNKYQKETETKNRISDAKEKKAALFLAIARKIPWVQFIGYSGSIAMRNADTDADIDLFVIAEAGRLWSTRFLLVFLALILGRKRWPGQTKAPDAICLNLFFDERNVAVPKERRSLFTAHEVLQVRPVINKNKTYERFLWANRWVARYFPNNSINNPGGCQKQNGSLGSVERILRFLQLLIMRERTTEVITETQLWFIPQDASKSFPPRGR